MDLILLLLGIAILGFIVWLITTKIPMPPAWATALQVIALVAVLLYALTRFVKLPNILP